MWQQKEENKKCDFERKETKVTQEYKICRPSRGLSGLSAWNSHVQVNLGYRSRCPWERSLIAPDASFFPFVTFVSVCSKSYFLTVPDLRCQINRYAVRNQLASKLPHVKFAQIKNPTLGESPSSVDREHCVYPSPGSKPIPRQSSCHRLGFLRRIGCSRLFSPWIPPVESA